MQTELNTVERNMYKTLKNCPEENIERRWKRGHGWYLIGKKKTDGRNGETKFSFETIHIPEHKEPLKIKLENESKPAITEEILCQKIEELNTDIQAMKGRKSACEILLEEYFRK